MEVESNLWVKLKLTLQKPQALKELEFCSNPVQSEASNHSNTVPAEIQYVPNGNNVPLSIMVAAYDNNVPLAASPRSAPIDLPRPALAVSPRSVLFDSPESASPRSVRFESPRSALAVSPRSFLYESPRSALAVSPRSSVATSGNPSNGAASLVEKVAQMEKQIGRLITRVNDLEAEVQELKKKERIGLLVL